MSVDAAVATIARTQKGLVTQTQATGAGASVDQIYNRLRSGRWEQVRRGVYAIAGTPPTDEREVLAVCLYGGDAAWASHRTAGRLWGLGSPGATHIDVLTPAGRRIRLPGVRHHRSLEVGDDDVAHIGPIPLTSPARTLLDVSHDVPLVALGPIVDDALRRGIVTLETLRCCHERLATGSGRRPHVRMGAILDARQPGHRSGGSERELDVERVLVAGGLPPTARQHAVVVQERTYHLDHAYPGWRIAFEFDGWEHHGTFTAFHRDRERLRHLTVAGWTVIPVTSRTAASDLVRDTRAVIARRTEAIGA